MVAWVVGGCGVGVLTLALVVCRWCLVICVGCCGWHCGFSRFDC